MKPSRYLIAAIMLFVLAGQSNLQADIVRTREGRVIEGVIVGSGQSPIQNNTIKIRIGSSQIALPTDQVDSITTASQTDNDVLDARAHLQSKRAPEGVSTLSKALVEGASTEKLAAVIQDYGDLLATSIPALNEAGRQDLSRILAVIGPIQNPKNEDLMARRLLLHLCLGEREQANALFAQLGPDYFKSHAVMRQQMGKWLQDSLAAWTVAKDFERAQETLQDLQRVDPAAATGRDVQFYMQWASFMRDGGNFDQALQIYTKHLLDKTPEIARDRIQVTLQEAERTYRDGNQLPLAARLFETYGLTTIPAVARERLIQLWHDEGWQYLWRGEYAEARASFERAELVKKGSAQQDLLQCQYREQRAGLQKTDLLGHYQLGLWCMNQNLLQPALDEFHVAAQSKAVGPTADGYIGQIKNQLAEVELLKIMDLFQAGEYAKVLNATQKFMGEEHPQGYLVQAKEIEDMTKESLQLRIAQRPQQAESLYQQAQRAFYQGQYAKAESLLKTILEHYRDTVAYGRANTLYALVFDKLALARLEEGKAPKDTDTPTTTPKGVDKKTTESTSKREEIERLIQSLKIVNNPEDSTQNGHP